MKMMMKTILQMTILESRAWAKICFGNGGVGRQKIANKHLRSLERSVGFLVTLVLQRSLLIRIDVSYSLTFGQHRV